MPTVDQAGSTYRDGWAPLLGHHKEPSGADRAQRDPGYVVRIVADRGHPGSDQRRTQERHGDVAVGEVKRGLLGESDYCVLRRCVRPSAWEGEESSQGGGDQDVGRHAGVEEGRDERAEGVGHAQEVHLDQPGPFVGWSFPGCSEGGADDACVDTDQVDVADRVGESLDRVWIGDVQQMADATDLGRSIVAAGDVGKVDGVTLMGELPAECGADSTRGAR